MRRHQKKGTKKRAAPKVSIAKLSNKRLNRLAKQGKLKDKKGIARKKILQLVKDRVNPEQQRHLQSEDGGSSRKEVPDIPLEEADYDYYARPGRDLSFLSDRSFIENKRKRKRGKTQNDEISEKYEKVPRKMSRNEKNTKPLLPIKSKERGVIPMEEDIPDEHYEEDDQNIVEDTEETEPEAPKEPLPVLSTAELFQQRQEKLADRKQQLALLSSAIIEQPEDTTRKLKELRGLLEEPDPDICITVRKLAMVSLLEVFKDIIPGYRIRVSTDAEKTQTAKKETKKLRDFEESLISNYRKYLEYLEFVIKGKSVPGKQHGKGKGKKAKPMYNELDIPKDATKGVQEVAARCLCELLVTHPHFNYRTNIITVLMPCMTNKHEQISDMVCNYVRRIFREDKSGEVTLEVIRLIGRIIKAKRFDVKPKVLNTFLALKVKTIQKYGETDNKAARKAKLRQLSRKDRRRKKQMYELERELEDASSETIRNKKLRVNTEIINMVFLTYFRILKTARHSVLLSSVLEGLARFAHLINIDFFDDLFSVINELVDSEELTYRESLHCVQTAFTILSGQGAALNIDPIRFYTHLYQTLFQLHAGITSNDLPIALTCLDVMINKRRKQVSQQRMLAYLKRLTSLTLQQAAHGAVGCLATVRAFLHAFPRSDLLLDTDCQGSGLFMPELDEPEHCNAHNTAMYELHTLKKHYHPTVQRYSSHILAGAPSQGFGALPADIARKTPLELYADFDPSEMTFNPPISKQPKKLKKKVYMYREYIQKEIKNVIQETENKIQNTDITSLDFSVKNCQKVPSLNGHDLTDIISSIPKTRRPRVRKNPRKRKKIINKTM